MDEDGSSAAQALRRIAGYLNVPIETLFAYPEEATSAGAARVPTAEVRELLKAFTKLHDIDARKRAIDAATAEMRREREGKKQRKLK